MKLKALNSPLSLKSRRFLWCLAGITVAAFVLRLSVAYQLRHTYPPVSSPSQQTDNFTYIKKGMETANGAYDYSQGFYYQPFYYAVFLPTVFKIFGDGDSNQSVAERYYRAGVRSVIIAQSLLGAITVLLCGLLAASLFGRRCGILAAIILALARMPIFYTPFTLIATLQAFWMVLMMVVVVRAARKKSLVLFGLCGLVAGCGNLTRGNVVLLLPLFLVLALWTFRHEWKKATLSATLLIVMFMLPQLPFSLVNQRVHKRWVGPSSAGPAVLALGNTPEAPPGGREPDYGAGPMAYPPSYGLWMQQHQADGEDHVSLYANVIGWIKQEPMAWIELKARMLLLFWNRLEVPNNVSVRQAPSSLLKMPVLLDFWLIGSLGLAGLITALWRCRKKPTVMVTALAVVGYALSIVVFYILARFRVPVIPLVCVFAGFMLDVVWKNRRSLLKKRVLHTLLPLVAGFVLTCFGFQIYRYGWEQQIMRVARPNGVHVAFPDKRLVKDHGPMEFGGWSMVQVQNVGIQKTLTGIKLRPSEPTVKVKVFIASERDQILDVQLRNHQQKTVIKKGAQWVAFEVPVDNGVNDADDGTLMIDFSLKSLTGAPFFIYIDKQRNYRRTQLNGTLSDGELVLEVEHDVDTKPET